MRYRLTTAVTALALAFASRADVNLTVATGDPTGTYSRQFKEISKYCGTIINLHEKNTTGSIQNITMLAGNEVNAGFVQTDAWYLTSQTDDRLKEYKTLLALHPEEVHPLALAVAKAPPPVVVKGGWLSKDKQVPQAPPVYNTIADLAGKTVGVAGGSVVTARLINIQSQIGFKIREYEKNDMVLAAIDSGEVEAGFFVGGQPLGLLAKQDNHFKLLKIDDETAGKVKNVYRPARLNYVNLGAAGVPTVATDALLVTYDYKNPEMIQALLKLRQCVYENLGHLQEDTGNHPKWRSVRAENKGTWGSWYEPATKTASDGRGKKK